MHLELVALAGALVQTAGSFGIFLENCIFVRSINSESLSKKKKKIKEMLRVLVCKCKRPDDKDDQFHSAEILQIPREIRQNSAEFGKIK